MSTLEDVFYLYERNSRYYHDCTKIEECEDSYNNECYCHLKQHVIPLTIGDQYSRCNLKIKCYVKSGEECPICYDTIITKTSAFITNCGHAFHKKCLFKYMETKWLSTSYTCTARCPMCRCSLGHPEFNQRYRSSYFSCSYKNDNGLDKLEDFWLTKDYALPSFCSNRYDHYLGTKKICFICKSYREKGLLIYEIK
jgi:hypothetical protein